MTFFIRLTHNQLFSLLFIAPPLVAFLSISLIDPSIAFIYIFPCLIIFYFLVLFGWLYSTGVHLHAKLPQSVQLNHKRFELLLLVAFGYILFKCIDVFDIFKNAFSDEAQTVSLLPNISSLPFLLFNPFHLVAMSCVFYCIYFNAKSLKAVELQRAVQFKDFSNEFLLMWFFPIGIWFIQPRLNTIISNKA